MKLYVLENTVVESHGISKLAGWISHPELLKEAYKTEPLRKRLWLLILLKKLVTQSLMYHRKQNEALRKLLTNILILS